MMIFFPMTIDRNTIIIIYNPSNINQASQMNLSNPLVPLEILATSYRNTTHDAQSHLRAILKKFIAAKNAQGPKREPLLKMLSEGKEELISLKRKLSQQFEMQYSLYDNCKKRIHRHQELKQNSDQKKKFDFNSQIIQYLHSRNEIEKANNLSKALKEEVMFGIETNLLEQIKKICEDILKNDLASLKQWIHENAHNLDKSDSNIYFELACCEYINLIDQGEIMKGCLHLREKLKGLKLNKNQKKIIEKLTYLLIDPLTNPINIKIFLEALEQTFKRSFTEIYLINFDSLLERNLIVGISSLKTICCCKLQTKNEEICPICSSRANKLAQKIPMLTKDASSLKCRINQSIMNEQNYPLALPSGNIYSLSGLNETSKDDHYYCLNTETWYHKSQAKKVFLA